MTISYFKQETSYTCGPASLRMVLDSFYIKQTEKQISKITKANDKEGIWFKDLAKAVLKYNLSYIEKDNSAIKELKRLLKQKYRIIVCFFDKKQNAFHYSVIKKIDERRIFLYDPWNGPNKSYSIKYFNTIWKSNDKLRKDKWFIAII